MLVSWPQWTMLFVLVVGLASQWVSAAKNRELSSSGATLACFVWTAYYALFAGLLHAGGFW